MKTLTLVLTYHWFDETLHGTKRIEYRRMDSDKWKRNIWERRNEYTNVRFMRGMTKQYLTLEITKIDIGPCPIDGWNDQYFRIHFQ